MANLWTEDQAPNFKYLSAAGITPVKTERGWVHPVTGEVLVSIHHLDEKTDAVQASKSFGAGNSQINFVAKTPGTVGNSITVAFVVAGDSTALSVGVASNAITANLATDAGGVATSTVADVVAAINANTSAKALVVASTTGDGTGVVAAASATALAGGTGTSTIVANVLETVSFVNEVNHLVTGDTVLLNAIFKNEVAITGSPEIPLALGIQASKTFGTANSELTVTAKAAGTGGNAITVALVVSGDSTALSVGVASNAITVNLATDAGGAATSTAADVVAAINGSTPAKALVVASTTGDGTGVVAAASATALAGGTSTTAEAIFVGYGDNGLSIRFGYKIQETDSATALSVASPIALNGGTIKLHSDGTTVTPLTFTPPTKTVAVN